MMLNDKLSLFLDTEMASQEYRNLESYIKSEYNNKVVYPKYENIFRAFDLISPENIKVVILGQDPYHGYNQANGLAFSVYDGMKIPPSLKNIYKELNDDIGCTIPVSGDLSKWAEEGVLLINSVLTVLESEANSHKDLGWEIFTDSVIKKLSSSYENIVFILWGKLSQKKSVLIDSTKHCILMSNHPSPLSAYRGFFKSKPFSKTNNYLKQYKRKEIDWCLN
jgi:uracil-DNA glycosylase